MSEYVEEDRGYDTPCWIWQGGTSYRGDRHYGRKRWRGRNYPAHRAYYEEAKGCEVPADLQIDHLCRVTLCVNPDHLEPVTARENMRRSSRTKLTEKDVREIKRIYSKYRGDAPNARQGLVPALSRAFGVSYRTITRIAAGEKWGDVA